MASTFTFGFSGDDIDAEIEDDTSYVDDEMQLDTSQQEEEPELVAPRKHTLAEIVRDALLFYMKVSSTFPSNCR